MRTVREGRRRGRRFGAFAVLAAVATVGGILAAGPSAAAQTGKPAPATAGPGRACAEPTAPRMNACMAVVRPRGLSQLAVLPGANPNGYTPAQLQSAYNLASARGSGQTVAIVDAFDDPNAESDLAVYRTMFGLPACTTANGCFRKIGQNNSDTAPLPSSDDGWAVEISLDLDMVSAACPLCHIVLFEANSNSDGDLFGTEDLATNGIFHYISNSWGRTESSGDTGLNSHFNVKGIAITASSGDDGSTGSQPQYPAASPFVTAVGGTNLVQDTSARGWSETAWDGAGSGCSAFESRPTWQTVSTGTCTTRAITDISAVASDQTPVAIYDSFGLKGQGWLLASGTSAAAPLVASAYALAGTPAAGDFPASYPYRQAGLENDVVTGSDGTCGRPFCTAGLGWDGPTGLGSPNGAQGVSGFTVTAPGTTTVGQGQPVSLHLTASGGATPYTWSSTALPAGLSLNPTTGIISGVPTTSGSTSVGISATDALGVSGAFTFLMSVAPTIAVPNVVGDGVATAQNVLANAGLGVAITHTGTCDFSTNTVISQSPGGGARVAPGATVTINVARLPAGPHPCT